MRVSYKTDFSNTYQNRLNSSIFFDVLIGIGALGLTSWLVYLSIELNPNPFLLWTLIVAFGFIGLHPLILFVNYWHYGRRVTISICDNTGIIRLEKGENTYSHNIEHIEIYESASLPRYGLSYSYLKIYLHSKELVIITSLMTKNLTIPSTSIKPTIIKSFFPFIDKNNVIKNSGEDTLIRLTKHFEKYKTSKLEEISNSNRYQDISKKVALQILEKRKTTHNNGCKSCRE